MSRFFTEKYNELISNITEEKKQTKKTIKLDTNESPYPASQFVYRSIDQFEIDNLRMYSDPSANKLVSAIAENFGVESNKVAVGNGSDELLSFVFMAFQNKERKFYFPKISYGFYPVFAAIANANSVEIPMGEALEIVPERFYSLDGTIVIANPNTPTGLTLSIEQIEQIVSSNADNLVVIDEAYVDFGAESCSSLVDKYDNLLVIQTFSKSRNLAGARIGFAIGSPDVISDLNKIKLSFNRHNINSLSILAGTSAMKDKDYFKKCTNDIKKTRVRFKKEMQELGFEILDSKANFLFVRHPELRGEQYHKSLLENNIIVKHYPSDELKEYVRISIGLPDSMDTLIKVTKKLLGIEESRGE
ncbi:MAG: histidinol-phosphate transaminase [Aminipila sp.]